MVVRFRLRYENEFYHVLVGEANCLIFKSEAMANFLDIEKAHQRKIREEKQKTDIGGLFGYPEADIKEAVCKKITYQQAKTIILEYEWLGTMGQGMFCYGIFFKDVLAGAVCFGLPASLTSGSMFGDEYSDIAICLERGACSWWAHEHSASKLISFAVLDMSKTTKYRIFYAYSDDSAGEIGTVYQACNWLYLGRMAGGGSQNKLIAPDKKQRDSRHIMKYASKYGEPKNRTSARKILLENGWSNKKTKPKCKYVIVKGNKRKVKKIMSGLKQKVYNYPKRNPNGFEKTEAGGDFKN